MAVISYDFEDDTIGNVPDGWSIIRVTVSGSAVVTESGGDQFWAFNPPSTGLITALNTDVGVGLGDVVVTAKASRQATGANVYGYLRHSGGLDTSFDAYVFTMDNANWKLTRVDNGSSTLLASVALSFTPGTEFNMKLEASGGIIRGRAWTGSEPATWDIEESDSTYSTGGVAFGSYYTAFFDDITITSDDFSVDVDVTPGIGEIEITGYDPVVSLGTGVVVEPGIGTIEITGYDPEVRSSVVPIPVGSLEIEGYNPTISASSSALHLYFKFKDAQGYVWTREIDSKPIVTEVSSTYIADSREEVILCDATGGAFTVDLPTATGREGFIYNISKTDASANAITIDPSGAQTINGDATFDLIAQDETVTIVSTGSNWRII